VSVWIDGGPRHISGHGGRRITTNDRSCQSRWDTRSAIPAELSIIPDHRYASAACTFSGIRFLAVSTGVVGIGGRIGETSLTEYSKIETARAYWRGKRSARVWRMWVTTLGP
jgi:hypothetical protein